MWCDDEGKKKLTDDSRQSTFWLESLLKNKINIKDDWNILREQICLKKNNTVGLIIDLVQLETWFIQGHNIQPVGVCFHIVFCQTN